MNRRRDIIGMRQRMNGKMNHVKYYLCHNKNDYVMTTNDCSTFETPIVKNEVQDIKEPVAQAAVEEKNKVGEGVEVKKRVIRKKPTTVYKTIENKVQDVQNNDTAISDGGCCEIIPNRELILKELNKSSYLNQKLRKQKGGTIIML